MLENRISNGSLEKEVVGDNTQQRKGGTPTAEGIFLSNIAGRTPLV